MKREKIYYVYILSNTSKMLYIGVTNNLERRLWEHREKVNNGFTKKYRLRDLVYVEEYDNPTSAIAREKQLKGWVRGKKVALIKKQNPKWEDLAKDWFI